jgi:pyrroline-5-carboxylate reductase
MVVGFVGSGSMAAAMARGWAGQIEAMLFSDSGSGRAIELAEEVDGEAVRSNTALAKAAEVIVLAVKPAALGPVAAEIGETKNVVVSLLAGTSRAQVAAAFPLASVLRVMPNLAVQVRRGVIATSGAQGQAEVRGALEALGHVVELADEEFDAATAVMGCAPAYLALAVEAIAVAGARDGLAPHLSLELVVETAAGTAELLRHLTPSELRAAVASPGGSTEAGLAALADHEVPAGFEAAVRASLVRMRE